MTGNGVQLILVTYFGLKLEYRKKEFVLKYSSSAFLPFLRFHTFFESVFFISNQLFLYRNLEIINSALTWMAKSDGFDREGGQQIQTIVNKL